MRVWMNVQRREDTSGSRRWNALAELMGSHLVFTPLYGTLSLRFHTTLSSYFTAATHSWTPTCVSLFRVGRVKSGVIFSERYSFKDLHVVL